MVFFLKHDYNSSITLTLLVIIVTMTMKDSKPNPPPDTNHDVSQKLIEFFWGLNRTKPSLTAT